MIDGQECPSYGLFAEHSFWSVRGTHPTRLRGCVLALFVALASLVFCTMPCYSEELENVSLSDVKKLDLKEAINTALNYNRTILQEKEDNSIYKFRLKEQVTYFLPTLQTATDFKYNTNVKSINIPGLTMGSGPIRSEVTTSVSVVQPISDLYKTSLNYRIAKENLGISDLQLDLQNETVINDVSGLYFDLIKQKRIIEYYKKNISKLEEYYKVAVDHFNVGDSLARDYLKIQIEVDNSKHQLLVEENKFNVLLYQFKDQLGLQLNENVEIIENFEADNFSSRPIEELLTIAIENRPEIGQSTKSVTLAKLNRKVQIAQYIPQVDFYTSYYHIRGSGFTVPNNVIVGVNVSYDFWDWNRKHLGVKEQNAEIKKQELQLKDLENQIFIELKTQLNTINEAQDSIIVAKNNLQLAEESLRITKNRFDVGIALILDLLDDQTTLLDSQVQLVSSELDYQKSLINLKKVLGVLNN